MDALPVPCDDVKDARGAAHVESVWRIVTPDVHAALPPDAGDCATIGQLVASPIGVTVPVKPASDQSPAASNLYTVTPALVVRSGIVQLPELVVLTAATGKTAHWAFAVAPSRMSCPPSRAPMNGVMAWKAALTVTEAVDPKLALLGQTVAVTFAGRTVTKPLLASEVAAHMTVFDMEQAPAENEPLPEAATRAPSFAALATVILE